MTCKKQHQILFIHSPLSPILVATLCGSKQPIYFNVISIMARSSTDHIAERLRQSQALQSMLFFNVGLQQLSCLALQCAVFWSVAVSKGILQGFGYALFSEASALCYACQAKAYQTLVCILEILYMDLQDQQYCWTDLGMSKKSWTE